ncbi:DMT family transporter [Sulfurirhabdus autotrophica]|uniref:Threonine/homoserine efflux transporter RhtA n=1 Tax=Sulfurirhabdus autotrophica TaxID=1706046 RepID=A0A4R3XVV2_9PROT|nr:DMT family transporter [Sulfurirhabdus autotrophica]TCV82348.1 threonine/homoserine efflux transporter RhtA [Sulfurirhabdus autotrophica]
MKSGWMVVAGVLFALMGAFVKFGSEYFSSAELVFYRSLIGLLVIYLIVKTQKLPLATPHWRMHLWRGLSGFVALMFFFTAIGQLPLATAITLNYTSPLFLALLITFYLKERPHWPLIFSILLGFTGVILLLRPTMNHGQLSAGLLGLASGFLAGIAYLNVKQLGQIGEPEWRVVYYFTLISTIGAGIWMIFHSFHPVTTKGFLLLLGLGTTATLAQLAMTRAYRLGSTLIVASLAYTTVIFASLLGILFWGEILSLTSWIAIFIIVISGVISVRTTPKISHPKNETPT